MQYKSSCMCMQFVTAKKIPTIFKKKKRKKRQTIEKEKKPSYIPAQYGVGCNIKTLLILKKKSVFFTGRGKVR